MEIMMFLLLVIILGIAASLWGVDSRDGIDSPEWARRAEWWSGGRRGVL